MHWLVDALENYFATINKRKPFTRDQLPYDIGDKKFAAFGLGCCPSGDYHRGTKKIVVLSDWLARVNSHSDTYGLAHVGGKGSLKGDGTFKRPLGRAEGGHEPISHGLHLGAAMRS